MFAHFEHFFQKSGFLLKEKIQEATKTQTGKHSNKTQNTLNKHKPSWRNGTRNR